LKTRDYNQSAAQNKGLLAFACKLAENWLELQLREDISNKMSILQSLETLLRGTLCQ